jgi:hypothetical protein
MDGRLSCRVRGPRIVPLTGRPISRAVLRAMPRADFEAQALARAGHEHGTSTKAVGPGRASIVPNRAVLVPAQRARPVWPPIMAVGWWMAWLPAGKPRFEIQNWGRGGWG